MAEVYEQKLGQPEEAIAAYREVLSLDPASALALTALDALFTRQSGGKSSPTTSRRSCGSPRKRSSSST
jgi:tetratricopeptide (TPR) repeat protein